jgi:hypothetical protein
MIRHFESYSRYEKRICVVPILLVFSFANSNILNHTKTKIFSKFCFKAVTELRRLISGFLGRRGGFNPRAVIAGFVVDEAALQQASLGRCRICSRSTGIGADFS